MISGRSGCKRILAVSDQPLIVAGLRSVLAASMKEGSWILESQCRPSQGGLGAHLVFDLVVLDVRPRGLGRTSTWSEAPGLVVEFSGTPVIVLAEPLPGSIVLELVRSGVAGILDIGSSEADIAATIRRAMAGESTLEVPVISAMLDAVRSEARRSNAPITELRRRILDLVAQGLSDKEIAGQLHISTSSVKHNLAVVRHALGASNRAGTVYAALRNGIIL